VIQDHREHKTWIYTNQEIIWGLYIF